MAILRAYAIFDRKATSYNAPFFLATDGQAIRGLTDLAADMNTTVGRHPSDFVLYLIGSFDDQNGQLVKLDPIVHVMDAIQVVPKQPADLFGRELKAV